MNKPLVSVIVLNWNGKRYLEDCVISLQKQSYSNFEVILVDNGSTDNSVDFIKKKFPWVKLVENKENLGFAAGNNKGIRISSGRYIATLNNDTKADSKWLESLVNVAESSNNIGMCASKVLLLERPNVIDSVGINIYPDGMSKQRGYLEIDMGQYDKIEEILLPSACAALYRREMLEKIGLFDESFFAYCEDTDLGLRGKLRGWKALLVPSAIVYHLYSGTAGRYSPLKAYFVERNHFWVALKIFPLRVLLMLPLFTLLRLVVQTYNVFVYSGKTNTQGEKICKHRIFLAILKGYVSAICGLPAVFKKRRIVWAEKKISNSQIYDWFKQFRLSVKSLTLNR